MIGKTVEDMAEDVGHALRYLKQDIHFSAKEPRGESSERTDLIKKLTRVEKHLKSTTKEAVHAD